MDAVRSLGFVLHVAGSLGCVLDIVRSFGCVLQQMLLDHWAGSLGRILGAIRSLYSVLTRSRSIKSAQLHCTDHLYTVQ